MDVFVSWSGEWAKAVATALDEFLPVTIQSVDAWMSDQDIEAGTRWAEELALKLDSTSYGIICATRQSLRSKWLYFEAGALSKSVVSGRVSPYVIDGGIANDLPGPLAQFQASRSDREGTWALVRALNSVSERRVEPDKLQKSFDGQWPGLEKELIAAEEAYGQGSTFGSGGSFTLTPKHSRLAETTIRDASLSVVHGDIAEALQEVVVSSDDNKFRAAGGVSKAILRKLGEDGRRELERCRQSAYRQGQLAITTGGDWGRRAIIHAAVIDYEMDLYPSAESLRVTVRRVLDTAVAMGATSIAVPVLGGGHAKRELEATENVGIIFSEIAYYLEEQPAGRERVDHVSLYVYRREDAEGLSPRFNVTLEAAAK